MASLKVSRRYAKSLLHLAIEQGKADRTFSDMELVQTTCHASRDLALFLKSPIVNVDKKLHILSAIFKTHLDELTYAFVEMLTRKKREFYLEEIANSFIDQFKVSKGIETVSIKSAVQLSEEVKTKIIEMAGKITTDKIELQEIVDANLIGGFVLRVGDRQIDASILSNIRELKKNFDINLYLKDY